jgi:Arc/MetJ family transcription regulator
VRATVSLDDELLRRAQEYSGLSERTDLLREALKALIEREASRSLAALEGTMPDLKDVRRLRVDDL